MKIIAPAISDTCQRPFLTQATSYSIKTKSSLHLVLSHNQSSQASSVDLDKLHHHPKLTSTHMRTHTHTHTHTQIPTVKASIQQICLIWIRGATIVCRTQSLWVVWMLHLTPAWASEFFSFFIFVLYILLQWRFNHKVLVSLKKKKYGVKPSTPR